MSVKDIFFSDKNVGNLTKYLRSELELDNSKRALRACRELLLSQMKLIFEKNKSKLANADPSRVVPKLNDKSVAQCIKVYSERTKKPSVAPHNGRVRQPPKSSGSNGPSGLSCDMGAGDFAPFLSDNVGFIGANGTGGDKMFFGNINEKIGATDRKSGNDEIEQRMLMRQAEYEMPNNMLPNKPQEINFCIDGGNTRGESGPNNMKFPNTDLGGYDGMNDMMGMNSMGNMGMNSMGNMGMNSMGNMGMNPMGNMGMNPMGNMGMNPMGNMGMNPMGNMGMNPMGNMGMNPMANMGMNPMANMGMNPMANMGMNPMGNMGMNPMANMGMNPMANMGMNQTNSLSNGSISGMDIMMNNVANRTDSNRELEKKLAELQMEREKANNMNTLNYQQFQQHQNGTSELRELVNDKKKELAKRVGLSPEAMLHMTPEQIDAIVNRSHKKEVSSDDESSIDIKKKLLAILTKKKLELKESEEMNEQKFAKKTEKKNDEPEPKRTSIRPKIPRHSNIKTEITDIVVKADECAEPEFYNNYVIDLDKEITNISTINIESGEFPILKPVIDEQHNTLCIIYKNDKLPICLDNGDNYKLNEIITGINSALEEETVPIHIKETNNKICIESENKTNFSLDMTSSSIGYYLGFTKPTYDNSASYIGENDHMFGDKNYFMFIKELCDDPICEITAGGELKQLLSAPTKKNSVTKLTIQYRTGNTDKSEFVNFYEAGHEFKLIFTSKAVT